MSKIKWDQVGERKFENGVDHGVLYLPDETGVYDTGFAWNGLVSVTEKPSGAEPTPVYADNIKYITLISAEEYAASIEAITYPDEFMLCDGTAEVSVGVYAGQQARRAFGLSYRTKIGDDLSPERGYKIHLIYGALAAPTEKAHTTINDSPEAATFTWELSTTPVEIEGFKPTASLVIDSTKVDAAKLKTLEDLLYGTASSEPSLPTPDEVVAIFGAAPAGAQTMGTQSFSNSEDNSTDFEVQSGGDADNAF
jgi:hypothetical protein